jgi:hypothetical protein
VPSTYDKISSYSSGSAQTSITLSSIPATYTDIVAVLSNVRHNTSQAQRVVMQINGDTGSNYSETRLVGNGTTATSSRNSSATLTYTGLSISATDTNVQPSTLISQIQNYSNTTTNKTVLHRGSSALSETSAVVTLYRSTSAITSVTFFWDGGGQFSPNTILTLYGIKAA